MAKGFLQLTKATLLAVKDLIPLVLSLLKKTEEITETFAAGEYTPTQIAKELNIKKFTPLMNNLEKAGVKVIYDPQAKGSNYMQGKITLNNLSTSLFLEEALHAGLDTLPKAEKTKLRKDVLKWYKQLVKNHAGEKNAKGIQAISTSPTFFLNGTSVFFVIKLSFP